MKKILFILFFLPSLAGAVQYKYVQIPQTGTGTLQPSTTAGFFVSSGTVSTLYTSTLTLFNGITGTITNDNALQGNFGEYLSSSDAGNLAVLTNAQFVNIATITLTAGDWDISGVAGFSLNGATANGPVQLAISTFSAGTTTDQVEGDNQMSTTPPTSSAGTSISIPAWRRSLASTTNIYLKALGNFSAGTEEARGRISARRVR